MAEDNSLSTKIMSIMTDALRQIEDAMAEHYNSDGDIPCERISPLASIDISVVPGFENYYFMNTMVFETRPKQKLGHQGTDMLSGDYADIVASHIAKQVGMDVSAVNSSSGLTIEMVDQIVFNLSIVNAIVIGDAGTVRELIVPFDNPLVVVNGIVLCEGGTDCFAGDYTVNKHDDFDNHFRKLVFDPPIRGRDRVVVIYHIPAARKLIVSIQNDQL